MENFGNGEDGTCVKVWNTRKMGNGAPDEIHLISRLEGGHGGADPRVVEEFLHFVHEDGRTNTAPLFGGLFVFAVRCSRARTVEKSKL